MMRRLLIQLVLCAMLSSVVNASVDFVYNIHDFYSPISDRISIKNTAVFVLPGYEQDALEYELQPIQGASYAKIYITHTVYTESRYRVSYRSGTAWIPIDGIFSYYSFDGTMTIPVNPDASKIMIRIECAPDFTGCLRSLRMRYFTAEPTASITLKESYPDIHDSRIVVTGKGLFSDSARDTLAVRKAERAAMLDAYRAMIVRVRNLSKQENIKFEETRIEGFVRGAKVEKKEQTDDGVVITMSIPINGVTGLNQLIKE